MDMVDEAQQLELDRAADALAALRDGFGHRTNPNGFCRDCGDPIDPERLAALPSATRCYDCQLAAERMLRK